MASVKESIEILEKEIEVIRNTLRLKEAQLAALKVEHLKTTSNFYSDIVYYSQSNHRIL